MKTVEQIHNEYKTRKMEHSPAIGKMRELTQHYNLETVIPLPEVDKYERPAVANLIAIGIDQKAMRIASTMPQIWYPPLIPGDQASERKARRHRKANLGWLEHNKYPLRQRRRARWFVGYGAAPVRLSPGADGIPRWDERNPLTAFPHPISSPAEIVPRDCIFTVTRTLGWVKEHYPERLGQLYVSPSTSPSTRYEILEYVDAEEIVLVLVGRRPDSSYRAEEDPTILVELERVPNRAETPLCTYPGRITLDRIMGEFDGVLGIYQKQAKLDALEYLALEQQVFPRAYLVARPGENPVIVQIADGRQGIPGVIKGGDLKELALNPSLLAANNIVDRNERNIRVTAGVPSEFGGELPTNARTARQGGRVMAETVDFSIQEAQEILAESLKEENRIATRIAKAYGGNTKRTIWVSWKGGRGQVSYVPNRDFVTDECLVSYARAGADANEIIVGGGQRIGQGTLSKQTFMEIDPLVDDPEFEHDRVIGERLTDTLLQAFEQGVAQGSFGPVEVARIIKTVQEDQKELPDAIIAVHEAMQQQQAAAQQAAQAQSPQPVPEAQPGLSPGQAPAGAPPAIGPPPQSLENLRMMLRSLRMNRGAAA